MEGFFEKPVFDSSTQEIYKIVIYNERKAVFMANHMITLPITLEQLITTINQLQPSDRTQVAQALIQLELQSDLKALIEELYNQAPVDEITDSDIMHEIKAARQQLNK
jgi:hypothetical protein